MAAYATEEESHMYNKVKQYALNNGFTVEEKNGLIYGKMNGFFFPYIRILPHQQNIPYTCGSKRTGRQLSLPSVIF